MPRRKKHVPVTIEETRKWLQNAVHSAPRPLPAGFFPKILEYSVGEGFLWEDLLKVLDEWLNYGYCRIIDPITQDVEVTPKGESFFY